MRSRTRASRCARRTTGCVDDDGTAARGTGARRAGRRTDDARRAMQLPRHVRFIVMWVVFRFIGAFLRRIVSGPEKPVEKKRVVECETEEAFDEALREAKAKKRVVVIDFTATWCGPCKRVAPVFADMSEEYDAMFLKVDVDKNSTVSGKHNVTAMPTFAFYTAAGEVHDEQIRGANVAKIVETLEKLGAKKIAKTAETKKDK